MKTFMMIFRFEPNFSYKPTPEDINKQQESWGKWIGNLASTGKMMETNRFGFEGKIVQADATVLNKYYAPKNKMVSSYMTLKVASEEEVIEIAKECPIKLLGGFTEIREIVAM
ncbi:MAG: YciI family protein [Polaribacter sp.]